MNKVLKVFALVGLLLVLVTEAGYWFFVFHMGVRWPL
jgi:hypothetical protein